MKKRARKVVAMSKWVEPETLKVDKAVNDGDHTAMGATLLENGDSEGNHVHTGLHHEPRGGEAGQ